MTEEHKYSLEALLDAPKRSAAHMIVIAGKPGVGKSTLAATFPDTFVINAGARFDGIVYKKITPLVQTFEDAIGWLRTAARAKEMFKSIVIDDLDGLINAEWQGLRDSCSSQKEEDELFSWGGNRAAERLKGGLQNFLDALRTCQRKHGFHIVALAHSESVREKPAHEDEYFTNNFAFHAKLREVVRYAFDTILFAEKEIITEEVGNQKRKRRIGGSAGEYVLQCEHGPRWEMVKNSHHLPPTIPTNGVMLQRLLDEGLEKKVEFADKLAEIGDK